MVANKKLDSLTGLRFYLAIFVFFYHGITQAHLELGKSALDPKLIEFLQLTFNGSFAVSSFFVLSGFVMWYSYSERHWTFSQFVVNRIARLMPVYLLGILIVLLRWNNLLNEFGVSATQGIQRLLLSILMLQSWGSDWRATQMFNGPGWTLSVEMFFYLTFPILFWVHSKKPKIFFATCVLLTLFTLFGKSFGFHEQIPFCIRFWGFFTLGIVLCAAWKSGIRFSVGTLWVMAFLFLGYQTTRWTNEALVSMLIPVLLIGSLATADSLGRSSPFFASRWIILGGEISYAIYILHAPIQTIVYSLFFRSGIFLLKADSLSLKLVYLMICFLCTLTASYLAWRFIEVPGRKWISSRFARSRT